MILHGQKVIKRSKIYELPLSFDKVLPNRIPVSANKLTKSITLGLKNKTFRQIIIACGLGLEN
jgi:hypothetical protein